MTPNRHSAVGVFNLQLLPYLFRLRYAYPRFIPFIVNPELILRKGSFE